MSVAESISFGKFIMWWQEESYPPLLETFAREDLSLAVRMKIMDAAAQGLLDLWPDVKIGIGITWAANDTMVDLTMWTRVHGPVMRQLIVHDDGRMSLEVQPNENASPFLCGPYSNDSNLRFEAL